MGGGKTTGHLSTAKAGIEHTIEHEHTHTIPCYLSRSRDGRWGTAEETWANFLHSFLLLARRLSCSNFRPVHSLMLSPHCLLGLPCPLFPGTVPCKMVFASPLLLVTCPNHFNFLFFTVLKSSSYGPAALLILSSTSTLVTRSL